MEGVLEVYQRPRDRMYPVVCVDEMSKQLVGETRVPIKVKPGHPVRHDHEYERKGTANLFMMFAPLEGWRYVKVIDRHTAVDYAHVLKELSDQHFSSAKKIILVQDNLNTHTPASLYEAFPAAEARRLVERFEWHYTPKHGSWLDPRLRKGKHG
jgi:DDE superfamily endonuclease